MLAVSAPFRGTQLVYLLGEQTDNAPAVRTFSLGSALAKMVHIISYLTPFLPSIFDLHTDSRSLSFRETSFVSFLKQLWHSDWAEGRDATPFDVTFQAAEEREAKMEGMVCPRTFYRSYAATMVSQLITFSFSVQKGNLEHVVFLPSSSVFNFLFNKI